MQDARTGGHADPISQADLLASVRDLLGPPAAGLGSTG
jgi:hypothetical protein